MSDYEAYVQKYCRTYRISKQEAEQHMLVQLVKIYYEGRTGNNNECN